MKKLFKGAVPTLALMLVAIMSLTSLTYAWFTAGNTATVDTVTVDVKSVEGLLISADGTNGTWGSSMAPMFYANTSGSTTSTGIAGKLRDISTAGEVSNGTIRFFSAEYDNVFDALTSAKEELNITENGTANWVAFDVYMKNDGNTEIKIDLSGSVLTATALTRAAARVAVVNQGTASSTIVLADSKQPAISGTPALVNKIWEPNNTLHTADGDAWLSANNVTGADGLTSVPYWGVKAAFTNSAGVYYNRVNNNIYSQYQTELALNDGALPSGTYYVYTQEKDHFRELKTDDFYKVASQQIVAESVAATSAGVATPYFANSNGTYIALKGGETLVQGQTYYEAATVGGTATGNVFAYTKDGESTNMQSVVTTSDPSTIIVTLPAETITKLTFFVWFEGQDCDCNNSVAGNNFTLDIKFNKIGG